MSANTSDAGLNAERFSIPLIEGTEAGAYMVDALNHVIADRKGVAVIGPMGAGKSVALQAAVDDFREAEPARAKQEEREEYRVLVVQSPRSKERRGVIGAIFRELFGTDQETRERGGRNKSDDTLLQELVELLLAGNIGAIVFDEAEALSQEGILVARDLISRAELQGKGKRYQDGQIYSFGVGVLLVGTEKLRVQLRNSGELGQRWIRVQKVELLDPAEAAAVYRRYLAAFDKQANGSGDKAWRDFVRVKVAMDQPMPIRHIENHVRAYVRRAVNVYPEAATFDELPFDEEIFFQTLNEIPRRAG